MRSIGSAVSVTVLADRRRLLVVRGHVRQVLLDDRDALGVVGDLDVADPRLARVDA
jgi:hypothetical protein